jgi:hypothetical protein
VLASVAAFRLGSDTNRICIYKGLRVRCDCSGMYGRSGVNELSISTQGGGGEELAETLDASDFSLQHHPHSWRPFTCELHPCTRWNTA